jgi:sugar O-acyltransferase (sialic acid O-acetyltransferase NeuD family)
LASQGAGGERIGDGMLKDLVLWGATGQAKVLAEFVVDLGYRLAAIFDNNPAAVSPFADVPLYVGEAGFQEWLARGERRGTACLVAVGGSRGRDRLEILDRLKAAGLQPVVAVHPRAYVARGARVGEGGQILANATVGAHAILGTACLVNTAASVDHDCVLGDGVHVAPGATLAGEVNVGTCSFIAAGAVVLPRIRIGSHAVVGAGSVVTRDVADGVVAYGNPAKVIRPNSA